MSRIPAKTSLKILAPRMASPLTSPKVFVIREPETVGVVTTSMMSSCNVTGSANRERRDDVAGNERAAAFGAYVALHVNSLESQELLRRQAHRVAIGVVGGGARRLRLQARILGELALTLRVAPL